MASSNKVASLKLEEAGRSVIPRGTEFPAQFSQRVMQFARCLLPWEMPVIITSCREIQRHLVFQNKGL